MTQRKKKDSTFTKEESGVAGRRKGREEGNHDCNVDLVVRPETGGKKDRYRSAWLGRFCRSKGKKRKRRAQS